MVVASSGSRTAPNDVDVEALALLGERPARTVDQALGLVLAGHRRDQAELVAAQAVRVAALAGHARELRAQAREERVAGGVPEGVVVALEPVEVEDHQEHRGHLFAPERVSRSTTSFLRFESPVSASVTDSCFVRSKRRRLSRKVSDEAYDDEQHGRGGEAEREQVHSVEVVPDEEPGGGECGDRREPRGAGGPRTESPRSLRSESRRRSR